MQNNNFNNNDLLFRIQELESEIKLLKQKTKYGLVWEDKEEDVVKDCENKHPVLISAPKRKILDNSKEGKNKPTNILIEGDNYHALQVLNYTHKEKIDVIYIDPPYNTGAKDWKYNNDYVDINHSYRHSRWLSMMKHRLDLAKSLLKETGVLICAIDENEVNRLGLLLEQTFGNHELHCVTIVHNPRGVQGNNFSYTHEYAFFSFPKGSYSIGEVKRDEIIIEEFKDHGGESLRTDAKNCFYPILVKNKKIIGFGEVVKNDYHPKKNVKRKDGVIEVYPIDVSGIERKWVFARNTVESILSNLFVEEKSNGEIDIFRKKDMQRPRTVWFGKQYDASTFGSKIVNNIIDTEFPFPKSLYNVIDCLNCVAKDNKNSIILDFFAGSGTTGHGVMEMNKEDEGNRQFILCTNNENNICEEVTYERLKRVMKGYKNKKGEKVEGLGGNLEYLKTNFVDKTKHTDNMKIRMTRACTEMLCLKEGVFNLIKEEKENDNLIYKVFSNGNKSLGIYFDLDDSYLDDMRNDLKNLKTEINSAYIFTLSNHNDLIDDHRKWKGISLEEVPQKILEIYEGVYKK